MVAVVGDIHGCFYTLRQLIDKVRSKYPGIAIYSVGDLIDRGNFSYEVIEFLLAENISFAPGNHDYMFYYFINHPSSQMGNAWLFNGSEATLKSYRGRENKINEHLQIIGEAPLFFNLPDCFISHAGISKSYRQKLPKNFLSNIELLDNILRSDLSESHSILWTRGELLNAGKLQVVGHTRRDEIVFNKFANVLYIDTSVYVGNKLSAVIIDDNQLIDVMAESTNPLDLAT